MANLPSGAFQPLSAHLSAYSNVKQRGDTSPRPRGANRARVMQRTALERRRAQGRPGAGRARGPPANKKSWRQSPQVWPKHPGPPCAMVLTLIARSPWRPGFLAPIARSVRHASKLDLSVGRPGPHAFASVPGPFVRAKKRAATRCVHRIPRPTFVTIAKRPSGSSAGPCGSCS
jgi:hypothetical protein